MKKKLLVVCGGQSSEHSISRISCNSVMKHLDKDKYEITLVGIAKDGKWYILKQEDNDLSKDTWLDGAEVVEGVFDLLDFTEKMELSRDYLNWHSFRM